MTDRNSAGLNGIGRDAKTLRGWFVAGGVFLLAGANSAFAADLRVPSRDFRTLDDALDRAQSGDRIVVRGRVREFVAVEVPGVTIVAKHGASVVGGMGIYADGVRVEGFRFRGADLEVDADQCSVAKNRFLRGALAVRGDDNDIEDNSLDRPDEMVAVAVNGDGNSITGNDLDDGMCGFVVEGDGTTFSDNEIDDTEEAGAVVMGDDAIVTGNDVDGVWSVDGIAVQGDGAVVNDNEVTNSAGGIRCEGGGCTVSGNDLSVGTAPSDAGEPAGDWGMFVTGCPAITVTNWTEETTTVEDNQVTHNGGSGIHVEGGNAVVVSNDVDGVNSMSSIVVQGDDVVVTGNDVDVSGATPWGSTVDGIDVRGDSNEITNNDVTGVQFEGAGVRVEGRENDIVANVVHDVQGDGFAVDGKWNVIADNVADGAGRDGFIVDGWKNTIEGDQATASGGCGILVFGNADVTDCSVGACGMGGLVNLATGTDIAGTTSLTNDPVDLINLGSIDENVGNQFGTTSTDRDRFRDLDDMRRQGFNQPEAPSWGFPAGLAGFGW